MIAKKFIF